MSGFDYTYETVDYRLTITNVNIDPQLFRASIQVQVVNKTNFNVREEAFIYQEQEMVDIFYYASFTGDEAMETILDALDEWLQNFQIGTYIDDEAAEQPYYPVDFIITNGSIPAAYARPTLTPLSYPAPFWS